MLLCSCLVSLTTYSLYHWTTHFYMLSSTRALDTAIRHRCICDNSGIRELSQEEKIRNRVNNLRMTQTTHRTLHLHTLPNDCGCIIFTWLQTNEAIKLSRTSRWWYAVSSKKQAYQPLPLPSFDRDDFDLLAYERWKSERDPFIWRPKELVQCSTSRIMQHQQDIVLIFKRCHLGRFHGLDGVTESDFQIGLERFLSVRCLKIKFRSSFCHCPEYETDHLLPDGTVALITRVIRTWSQSLISFQINVPIYGSQVFNALAAQSLSIPHLQHAILPDVEQDAYTILQHGFHTSSAPAGSFSSQPPASFVPSRKFGGVLELIKPSEPWYEDDRVLDPKSLPFNSDPHYFAHLKNCPHHVLADHSRYERLAPQLIQSHILPHGWNLFEPFHPLSSSFQSIGWYKQPSSRDAIEQDREKFKRLIADYLDHQSSAEQQQRPSRLHPFASLQSIVFKPHISHNKPILIHDLNHLFPALNTLHLPAPLRIQFSPSSSLSTNCTWLRHLSIHINLHSSSSHLQQIVLGLTSLENLNLILNFSSIFEHSTRSRSTSAASAPVRGGYLYRALECLVLASPHLCQVSLDDQLTNASSRVYYRLFRSLKAIRAFQIFLIHVHLIWKQLVPSHTIPSISSLHPITQTELLPLHLPFSSRGHRSLVPLCAELDQDSKWIDRRLYTLISRIVSGWFNRLSAGVRGLPTKEELNLQAEEAKVRSYLERETHALNDRIHTLLASVGRSTIQPRHSYFRMCLFGGN